MNLIENLKEKAKQNKKTIMLIETDDERILEAGAYIHKENIANIIFLNTKNMLNKVKKLHLDISNIKIIENKDDELKKFLAEKLYQLRKSKGITFEDAYHLLNEDIYFGMMCLHENICDGIVAGAVYSSKDVLKPALQIIKTKEDSKFVSSSFFIDTKKTNIGENGILLVSDCALMENPSSDELAEIAIQSAKLFEKFIEKKPKVAMLSYSSFGSAMSPMTEKVTKAVQKANEITNYIIDGEMQLDVALRKEVAKYKAKNSKIKGDANILVFPDLNSGNIGYKLIQIMSDGLVYGPILQGINKPINDISRGASIEDIIGTIIFTAIEAQNIEKNIL